MFDGLRKDPGSAPILEGKRPFGMRIGDDGKAMPMFVTQGGSVRRITDEWPQAETRRVRFAPSRDFITRPVVDGVDLSSHVEIPPGARGLICDEVHKLKERMGIKLETDDMSGSMVKPEVEAAAVRDWQKLIDLGRSKRAPKFLDTAPMLFTAQETVKHTNKIVEQDTRALTARSVFKMRNLNTWQLSWSHNRRSRHSAGLSEWADAGAYNPELPGTTQRRQQVVMPLAFHRARAFWDLVELARAAEARANGAPDFQLDRVPVEEGRQMCLRRENVVTYFGDVKRGLVGWLSAQALTGIERVPSPLKFGEGTPEDDRRLLVDFVADRINKTIGVYKPDSVGLGTKAWLHVTKTIYLDATANSGRSVAAVAMEQLAAMGVTQLRWIPELAYQEQERDALIEAGVDATLAAIYAGGIGGEDVMSIWKDDADCLEMIVGRDLAMFPNRIEIEAAVVQSMLMSSGGVAVYQPRACTHVTNVGPDSLIIEPP
jgi:hypothetical protein